MNAKRIAGAALFAGLAVLASGLTYTLASKPPGRPVRKTTSAQAQYRADVQAWAAAKVREMAAAGTITPAQAAPLDPKVPRGPVFTKGSPPPPFIDPQEQVRNTPYQGTMIKPHPKAAGDLLKFHQEFVAAFNRLDGVPDARKAHFAWIDDTPAKVVGWDGVIEAADPTEGGWAVKVRVYPLLRHPGIMMPLTRDYVSETYHYAHGAMTLISVEPPAVPQKKSFFGAL
jgi:hypothetical protein